MGLRRTFRGDNESPSRGVNLLNKLIGIFEDGATSNEYIKHINLEGGITKELPADVPEHTLYIGIESMPVSNPKELGQHNVNYLDVYVASIFYYDTTVDKGKDTDNLILTMDMLTNFFAENSSLNGLCSYGVIVNNMRITHVAHGDYYYNAVACELIIKVNKTRNRHP